MWGVVCWVLLIGSGPGLNTTFAHDPGLSTATVRLFPDKLEALITFAFGDASDLASLDADNDGQTTLDEFSAGREKIARLVAEGFEARFDTESSQATNSLCQLDQNNNVEIFLNVPGKSFSKLTLRSKMIAALRPNHRQYFLLQNPAGVMLAERLLSASADTISIQVDAAPAAPGPESPELPAASKAPADNAVSFRQFLVLGVEHIGTGYDHLLFLFALLLVTRSFRSALAVITCFTLAHSITLAVATFDLVQMPARITEPLIAATIVYVGAENILRHGDPHKRWLLTFVFGLIHGFGFASVLREMGVGARAGGVAMPLFSFNLGVELGQIAVAAVVLPAAWRLRKCDWFLKRGVPTCSVLVALAGAYWFIQRVWP